MKIRAVAASIPKRVITNDDIIDIIRDESKDIYQGDLETDLQLIKKLIEKTGLKTRRWCDVKDPEDTPIYHLGTAVDRVLTESNLRKEDVDLILYVGVGRGFIEPANACVVAHALGFHKAECFDITDACMSWVRALSVADAFFKTGAYKNALVVNMEFNFIEGGFTFPMNFRLSRREQLEHILPTFTVGEAASATLLTPDEPDNFKFRFLSRNVYADLCTTPIMNYQYFCQDNEKISKNGVMCFTSYGADLHRHLDEELPKVLNDQLKSECDVVFTHASSKADWFRYGKKAGIAHKQYDIYERYGNLVSASVPVAMEAAIKEGKLKNDSKVLCWMGSAGMSFASMSFQMFM